MDDSASVAPGTPSAPESIPAAGLADLLEGLAAIEAQLGAMNERAAHRETVIDRLHREKEELRRGERRLLLEPVVADLIRLHDALCREVAMAVAGGEVGHAELLRSFGNEVEQILDRCGIETLTDDPGAAHRVDHHRVVGVLPTDERGRHNTIAEVVALGFRERDSGRVRRPLLARFHHFAPAVTGEPREPAGIPDVTAAADGLAAG